MKRWASITFIVAYLGALTYGNFCHILQYNTGSHPLMYYVVWDMFCGWSAYAQKIHVIAEGQSEKFYELAPGPWGAMSPWGFLPRHNYDNYQVHLNKVALNALRHSTHEQITRIYVVEESWSKKYDLPDHVWESRFAGSNKQEFEKYCHIRTEYRPDGSLAQVYYPWLEYLGQRNLASNPRLIGQMEHSRPLLLVNQPRAGREMTVEDNASAPGQDN